MIRISQLVDLNHLFKIMIKFSFQAVFYHFSILKSKVILGIKLNILTIKISINHGNASINSHKTKSTICI